MPLPSKSLKEVRAMLPKQRTEYFEKFARFIPNARTLQYAIQVGSKTLMSDDTMDLRQQFNMLLVRAAKGTDRAKS